MCLRWLRCLCCFSIFYCFCFSDEGGPICAENIEKTSGQQDGNHRDGQDRSLPGTAAKTFNVNIVLIKEPPPLRDPLNTGEDLMMDDEM